MNNKFPTSFPAQHQDKQPGIESKMNPLPIFNQDGYHNPSGRLKDKVAIITGGDSGIGRAVSLLYAKEGAKVCLMYLNEHDDANITKLEIEKIGGECFLISGDIGDEQFCISAIKRVFEQFGKINILVNNAAEQHESASIDQITKDQLLKTFNTNFFGAFYLTKAVVPHLREGDSIIYTTSITAYHGSETLIDYSCTKGALTSLCRSLAKNLASKGIRVNAVAPGPIWTPLIPSSFASTKVMQFGSETALKRAGQPIEVAEAYVFLASDGASFITGETIHINGGEIINS